MNKLISSLICLFVFDKKKRKALRNRLSSKISIRGSANVFLKNRNFAGEINTCGNGNSIVFQEGKADQLLFKIHIYGNSNTVLIGENVITTNPCSIAVGTSEFPCNGAKITIGANTQLNGVNFQIMEDNSEITIGENCLFSWGIEVWATDSHSILDVCKNVKNLGQHVHIGNNVWVGEDVKIGKNTEIGHGSIVGWGSVVTKAFPEPNCIIAGNPAKLVKTDRTWNYLPPHKINSPTNHS